MTVISIALVIAIGLAMVAVGLMGWAYLNPKWQRADAYDALIPFSLGVVLLGAASVVAAIAGVIRLIFGGGA
ncbi:MAG: hypothetical protein KA223_04580 [Candidatus Accumulibacter sp.]|nr:hypothetical protein [Accumulibacter sp.]